MKDLKMSYTNENGERVSAEYDTVMDFLDQMESNGVDIPMMDYTDVDAMFFENELNTKHCETIAELVDHCKMILGVTREPISPPKRGIFYGGEVLSIEEYFTKRMEELGFLTHDADGEPVWATQVGGYYLFEAEYNTVAEYFSSCGVETEEEKSFALRFGYMTDEELDENMEVER